MSLERHAQAEDTRLSATSPSPAIKDRSTMFSISRLCVIVLFASLGISQMLSVAEAQSTSVRSRNGDTVLVNKDINGERWAITYDESRQTVTGNVLLSDGGATFIDCNASRAGSQINLECYSFDSAWLFLSNVTLPASFFGLGGGGGTCLPPPSALNVTYGDNCGVRASANVDFGFNPNCPADGSIYDASDLALEGARMSVGIDEQLNLTVRIEYRGACQGVATGTGRVTSDSFPFWRADGQITGSTTCCPNLSGTFAIFQ